MQLTQKQLMKLELSRKLVDSPPTLASMFRMAWRAYFALVLVFGGVIVYFLVARQNVVAAVFGGMFIATILRDIKWYNQFVRDWPLSREITDWRRVDDLLAGANRSAP